MSKSFLLNNKIKAKLTPIKEFKKFLGSDCKYSLIIYIFDFKFNIQFKIKLL